MEIFFFDNFFYPHTLFVQFHEFISNLCKPGFDIVCNPPNLPDVSKSNRLNLGHSSKIIITGSFLNTFKESNIFASFARSLVSIKIDLRP